MARRRTALLMEKGLQKLENPKSVSAWGTMTVPVGSKLFIIKTNEIELISPLFHIEEERTDEFYNYKWTKALLTCNNKIEYNCLVQHEDLYYTLEKTLRYTENGIYHYELKQCDIGNILIFDSVDQIPKDVIYDYTSLPELLNLFQNTYSIDIYPKALLVNKELLEDKCLFIQTLDSKTYSVGFNNPLVREDKIKIFLNNYSKNEVVELFRTIQRMIDFEELNIIGEGNIFSIKEIQEDSYVPSITRYIEFGVSYLLQDNVIDTKKYIESILLKINKKRDIIVGR